jgi:serine/threonine protein kinase
MRVGDGLVPADWGDDAGCPAPSSFLPENRDRLADTQSQWLDEHLESCAACQNRLDRLMSTYGAGCQSLLPVAIPGYRAVELLGRGGHSVVVLAMELATERRVALKLVPRDASDSVPGSPSWRNEVLVAAKMEHPNLVRLYGVHETNDWYGLVFEYVAGGTLQQRLRDAMSAVDAAILVSQIALGVQKIHELGFLHLDLKPSNVLLDVSCGDEPRLWVPKISDFGIARSNSLVSTSPSNGMNALQVGLGTLPYMAPEQVLGVESLYSPRTDVYGLGGLLADLLREAVHWKSRTSNHAKAGLLAICEGCLQTDLERRYASAKCVADALQDWLAMQCQPGVPSGVLASRGHRRRVGWTLVGGLLGLGISAVAITLRPATGFWRLAEESGDSAYDLPKWVSELDTAPAAITTEIATRLQSKSVLWTQRLLASRLKSNRISTEGQEAIERESSDFDLIYRCALLQRNAAERIAASSNAEGFPLSRTLLENAIDLLDRVDSLRPNREDIAKDWIQAKFILGCMRGAGEQLDTPSYRAFIQQRLNALVDAGERVERLQSPIQQVFWSGRILDELRCIHRYARWSSKVDVVAMTELAEADVRKCLHRLTRYPEIACRFTRVESREDMPSAKPGEFASDWLIPEDRDFLIRETLVHLLSESIFGEHDDSPLSQGSEAWDVWAEDVCGWLIGQGISSELLPKVVQQDVIRPVAAIGTQFRLAGQLSRAEQIQRRHLAMCRALQGVYPNHPDLVLAECESHLQASKNALRREADAEAIEALMRSHEMAVKALSIAPSNALAQQQVADRVKRLARMQSGAGTAARFSLEN